MSISRAGSAGATVLLLACGRTAGAPGTGGEPVPAVRVLPIERLFVLEMRGVPPEDTVASFPAGRERRILLRHAPPDNTVFAELFLPDSTPGADGGADSIRVQVQVQVQVRVRPGVYGVEVSLSTPTAAGARIRFKYPVHFAAPAAALARFGSATRFERALAIALRRPDGRWTLLPSTRPAPDNLEAPFSGTGSYLVVAPR